jgi:FkbM family methyltransferase
MLRLVAVADVTTIEEHTFLTGPLGQHATVLDFGANRGRFACQIVERFGCRCLAVEPVPEYAQGIPAHIPVHELAIGGRNQPSSFHVSDDPECSGLRGSGAIIRIERVRESTLDTFLGEQGLAAVDLVKVDIEGAEKELFTAASDDALLRVAQFTVEFHDFLGLLSRQDVTSIVERLNSLGFHGIKFTRTNRNWLFFQPWRCGVDHPLVLRYVTRNALYVARNARRLLRSP